MKLASKMRGKAVVTELAWLLGSWAFSFAAVGKLFGKYAGTLDIQLHNTYFVLPVLLLASLLFIVVSPVVTGVRVVVGRGQNVSASIVLALLTGVWLLLLLAVCLVRVLT
ncbi:hypothetical protein GO988_04495 [Hymenobacter sp. HMF4947]|uniref:Uncharacterized protein n=1 Tax=Hymenobacter ginkgonis TaxID=2682976 RepID=A0A7K1TB18_9BACT|nr:hypothetical protein [Hymenobacter ginkgonis]MVN75579.1 hypothetical protein [Hymenobacter ginkgonis]